MRRDDFRGPLPLSDGDFARIRARVIDRIERPSRARIAIPAFALAAAAAVAFLLIPHRLPNKPPARIERSLGPSAARAPEQLRQPRNSAARQPAPAIARTEPKHHRTPAPVAMASKGSTPSDNEMYLEIHTADPDVRIIWIGSR